MNRRQAKKAFKKKHGHNPVIIPRLNVLSWKKRGSYEHTNTNKTAMSIFDALPIRKGGTE